MLAALALMYAVAPWWLFLVVAAVVLYSALLWMADARTWDIVLVQAMQISAFFVAAALSLSLAVIAVVAMGVCSYSTFAVRRRSVRGAAVAIALAHAVFLALMLQASAALAVLGEMLLIGYTALVWSMSRS